jgi:hypothetical protein
VHVVVLQVVVEALATVVLLDARYKPLRMPMFFTEVIGKYLEPGFL